MHGLKGVSFRQRPAGHSIGVTEVPSHGKAGFHVNGLAGLSPVKRERRARGGRTLFLGCCHDRPEGPAEEFRQCVHPDAFTHDGDRLLREVDFPGVRARVIHSSSLRRWHRA
ncbi:hypothetical protein GCM10011577_03050 [Pseudarthrobacter polychromogenes]|uniref:Uncharacterized protein n=1 Tax=Pseudarthrobacter polychromogenes TaxID=1676 RepID=A0ABQ1XAW5_9MICC|nr:hypothetical protein GCM10011577_03050 [Pseudarthrobacter polychromogenes]